jgi:protein-S-isoprenylcysteine O-methyltransferase Ste14
LSKWPDSEYAVNLERASLAATAVLVVAVVTLLARHALFGHGGVSIAVQIAAGALMLWARLTFGGRSFHASANPTAGGVVTTGPYRFFRHPIYAATLYFVWAGVLSHAGVFNTVLAAVATAMVAVRIAAEERLLRARYPEYASYAATTKRLVPFLL